MRWVQDLVDPPDKVRAIGTLEAQRRAELADTPPFRCHWLAVCLGATLQAVAMAILMQGLLRLGQGEASFVLFALTALVPGCLIGVIVRRDHFLHGVMAAACGAVLGFFAILWVAIAFDPPPGASSDYGQGLGIYVLCAGLAAGLMSPLAGLWSFAIGQVIRHVSQGTRS